MLRCRRLTTSVLSHRILSPIGGAAPLEVPQRRSCSGEAGSQNITSDDAPEVGRQAVVYRRRRAEHHRFFRWGIGSAFTMENKNRFQPVHKERPKEVVVRDNYYDSDNPNIVWEHLNEAWEVYWYEHQKLNAKPFPVKKFGIERSKREAFAFFEELKEAGRLNEKPRVEPPEEGVFFDARLQAWVCFFWRNGRPLARSFSASKWGLDGAKALAMAKTKDPVHGVLTRRSRDAPAQLTPS